MNRDQLQIGQVLGKNLLKGCRWHRVSNPLFWNSHYYPSWAEILMTVKRRVIDHYHHPYQSLERW